MGGEINHIRAMKKLLFLGAFAMALQLASCTIEEDPFQEPDSSEQTIVEGITYPAEVYATIDDSNGTEAKAYVNENMKVLWDSDDRISLFNKLTYNKEYRFTGDTGASSGTFEQASAEGPITGSVLPTVYAVYPHDAQTTVSPSGVISLTLPAEQTYRENSFGRGANTMVSATNDTDLIFRNLCGCLVLKLWGDGVTVSSISLEGNNNEILSGVADITAVVDGEPSLALRPTGSKRITLNCPDPVLLSYNSGTPNVFWFVVPPTHFENGFSITVTDNHGRLFHKSANIDCEIQRNAIFRMATLEVEKPEAQPDEIDLGLSVKWASFNLGATAPEENGDYYAWGELKRKGSFDKQYNWSSYKWYNEGIADITKYNTDQGSTYFDNLVELEEDDDVAHVKLRGDWRMPTKDEYQELLDNCTSEWLRINGVYGRKYTSTKAGFTDKWIFLPAAGHGFLNSIINVGEEGFYSSSSLDVDQSGWSWVLQFDNNNAHTGIWGCDRYNGASIRPVSTSVTSVTLNKASLTLVEGNMATLVATVEPQKSAIGKVVHWSSSDESVAIVDQNGNIRILQGGNATITAECGGKSAECDITAYSIQVPNVVDLGLSVMWGSFNLGAYAQEGYGNYYAWGETETKAEYTDNNYKWYSSGGNIYGGFSYTKYNSDAYYGTVDNLVELESEDDAAYVKLTDGLPKTDDWRMPIADEFAELIDNCTVESTTINGIEGSKFTSKIAGYTNKWIFFPYSGNMRTSPSGNGVGFYWSSSGETDALYYYNAHIFYVFPSNQYLALEIPRTYGCTIRPVFGPRAIALSSVNLDKTELTIVRGGYKQLTATVLPNNATVNTVIWRSWNESVATVDQNGMVHAISPGRTRVEAKCGTKIEYCTVIVFPAPVDLGLSVKWAAWNLGASSPEGYGNYYAWGETETKSDYSVNTYQWYNNGNDHDILKYNTNNNYGAVDNYVELRQADDVAYTILGTGWRMPTEAETIELFQNCTWTETTQNGVHGVEVRGNNGNSIFLPESGVMNGVNLNSTGTFGLYWTSSLVQPNTGRSYQVASYSTMSSLNRHLGLTIRPVYVY